MRSVFIKVKTKKHNFNGIKNIPTKTLLRLLDDSCLVQSTFKDYGLPEFKEEACKVLWDRFNDKAEYSAEAAIDRYNAYDDFLDAQGVPELPVEPPAIPAQYFVDRFLLDTK